MIKLSQAVIVEGRYDKIKLSSIIDATIIETGGFKIFSDDQTVSLIQLLAKSCGVIIMTDSDFAGFRIRNYLKNKITEGEVFHAYLPDIEGKEKRKAQASKEGLLGVEGMKADDIIKALKNAGVLDFESSDNPSEKITKLDLYNLGLSGGSKSSQLRAEVTKRLNLPSHLSANALCDVLSSVTTLNELTTLVESVSKN